MQVCNGENVTGIGSKLRFHKANRHSVPALNLYSILGTAHRIKKKSLKFLTAFNINKKKLYFTV